MPPAPTLSRIGNTAQRERGLDVDERRDRLAMELKNMDDQIASNQYKDDTSASAYVGGAIVVFAKCPIAGASKTRLAPLLGAEGAAALAQAMLSDVLVSLCECTALTHTLKVLVYAPSTKEGEMQMVSILQSLHLHHQIIADDQKPSEKTTHNYCSDGWLLMPMLSSSSTTKFDLRSSSLGEKLQDALERTRQLIYSMDTTSDNKTNDTIINNESVLFLGMDSPELPLEEIVHGLKTSSGNSGKAHMCPAHDGGYGLLSVPKHAPSYKVFSGVRWSNSLTAVSQLKALTDSNVDVSIGRLMHDIDEPGDVKDLATRLIQTKDDAMSKDLGSSFTSSKHKNSDKDDVLVTSSAGATSREQSYPHHTWKALQKCLGS